MSHGEPRTQEAIDDVGERVAGPRPWCCWWHRRAAAAARPLQLGTEVDLARAAGAVARGIHDRRPGRIDRQTRAARAIGIGLMAVLVVGAAAQAVVLTVELVGGNKALNSADALLSSGALVWLDTIIAFSFVYWQIDGGGPAARVHRAANTPPWHSPSS